MSVGAADETAAHADNRNDRFSEVRMPSEIRAPRPAKIHVMPTECISIAGRRGALAAAFALLACVAAPRAFAAEPDACIAGEYVIGCQSEKDLDEIGTFHGDSEAMRKSIFDSIVSGKCKVFRDREAVLITDRTFMSERRLVRRPGEGSAYWMPAKWTRPIGECGPTAAPLKTADTPRDPGPAKPAPLRQQTAAQNKPAASAPTQCDIKPVMSDEDIAACRQLRR